VAYRSPIVLINTDQARKRDSTINHKTIMFCASNLAAFDMKYVLFNENISE